MVNVLDDGNSYIPASPEGAFSGSGEFPDRLHGGQVTAVMYILEWGDRGA